MSAAPNALQRFLERLRPSYFFTGALILTLHLAGALEPLDRSFLAQRFEWQPRAVSSGLTIVEIDAKSLQDLDVWPWPRSYYAAIIDRLIDAGARQIVIDVDFSSRSAAAEHDDALARAIQRAGDRLILPTFIQRQQALSALSPRENVPHPSLRGTVRLGTVNVRPEADGRIWRYPVGEDLPSGFRPSLAVALAGTGSYKYPDFLMDYGIDARALPRASFSDVLHGRIGADAFRDRNVLVGSTAAELGDYLAVPVYRSLPGVLLHALAYESVVQNRMIQRTGPVVTAIGLLALLIVFAPLLGGDRRSWVWSGVIAAALAGSLVAAGAASQAYYSLSIDSAGWLLAVAGFFLVGVMGRLRRQTITLFRQRMAQTHMRALMRAVVEDSFDGVIIANGDGYIELANRAALSILRRSEVSLAGLRVDSILPLAGEDHASTAREVVARRGDGTVVPLEVVVSASELRRSRRRHERRRQPRHLLIYTFRDISERQEAANAQKAALEAAVAASRAKSEFLANMSHELRTPLNAVIGFSEAMMAGIFGPIGSPKYVDYIRDIERSGRHLLGVIDQVLDVSRVEAGRTDLREDAVTIDDLATDCKGIMRGWLAKFQRTLIFDIAPGFPMIQADRQMLRQILLNLLSNAFKFTVDGGRIVLRALVDDDGRPKIIVEDDGIGIPAGKMERLTQAFYQVDGSATGTGLGLYLARHFVEAHGGTLTFSSTPGKGTAACVILPRERILQRRLSSVK
jgi:signal transduction histidine kinase/CHASE2 domain-containing sensor protein